MSDQLTNRPLTEEAQEARRLLDQGQEALETAADLPPDEAVRLCSRALELFKRARELAVDDDRLKREARLAEAAAYSQRGHHHRYGRNFAGSLSDLSQGLLLNPANAEDYYYRAMSYLSGNNPRLARLDLIEFLKRGEDAYLRDQAHARLAELVPGQEDPQAGSLHYRNEGMRLNSEAAKTVQQRTEDDRPDWLGSVRLYNQAIEAFNRSQDLNLEDKLARIGLITALKDQAEAYRQLEEYDLALANYDRALEIQPGGGQYLFYKAETLLQAGHGDLARNIFQDYLKTGKDPGLKARAQGYLAARPNRVNG